jgi:parvulin-like peptidyl-prolyl isomerase
MKSSLGLMPLGEHERLTYPLLYKAAALAPINKVVGPLQVKDGYSVFQVLNRQGGKLLPFFQVVKKASAFVRGQKREILFEALVDDLLDKYQARITVSSSALAAALADSFLQRPAEQAASKNDG